MADIEEVILAQDEIEAIRLKDLQGLSQGDAAKEMNISQPTLHRLLVAAHQKIADAFINGKAVRIEGGNVLFSDDYTQPCQGRLRWGCRQNVPDRDQSPDTARGEAEKIAVTSLDGSPDGMVSERFGRTRNILLFDRQTEEVTVIDNTKNMNSAQGAGIQTARIIVQSGAQAVISGHFGPKAFQVLTAAGVQPFTVSGMSISEALMKLGAGELTPLDQPDVRGHW